MLGVPSEASVHEAVTAVADNSTMRKRGIIFLALLCIAGTLAARPGDLLRTIPRPVQGSHWFGESVACADDYLVVGAPLFSSDVGRAFIYRISTGDLVSTLSMAGSELFGICVAATPQYAIVGSWTGLRIHDIATGALVGGSPSFQVNCLAVVGNRIVVGWEDQYPIPMTTVLIYDFSGNYVTEISNPSASWFGSSVARYGNDVLIGDSADRKAYLFTLSGTLLQTFLCPSTGYEHAFGNSIAAVGDRILVGDPEGGFPGLSAGGPVYVFTPSGTWQSVFSIADQVYPPAIQLFGWSLAPFGTSVVAGAPISWLQQPRPGYVTVVDCTYSPGTPILQLHNPEYDGFLDDDFGYAVATSGNKIIVGAPGFGYESVYIFEGPGSNAAENWTLYH